MEKQKEKERLRVASQNQKRSHENNDDDEIARDDVGDEDYKPSWIGHECKRRKMVTFEYDVDELRASFSAESDHRQLSSRGRSDILSDHVLKGGGDLSDVPSSQSTMTR